MMTAGERRYWRYRDQSVCATELCGQESVGRRVFSDFCVLPRFSLVSKGAIFVRGGVVKSTLVVDNDTTVHGVQMNTVAFSPSGLDQVW